MPHAIGELEAKMARGVAGRQPWNTDICIEFRACWNAVPLEHCGACEQRGCSWSGNIDVERPVSKSWTIPARPCAREKRRVRKALYAAHAAGKAYKLAMLILLALISTCALNRMQAAKDLESSDVGTQRANEVRVCRCIRLLKTMLSDFESKAAAGGSGVSIRKHGLRLRGEQVSLRLLRFASGVSEGGSRDPQRVNVFSNSTLSILRKEIARTLGEESVRLRLFASGRGKTEPIIFLRRADG